MLRAEQEALLAPPHLVVGLRIRECESEGVQLILSVWHLHDTQAADFQVELGSGGHVTKPVP